MSVLSSRRSTVLKNFLLSQKLNISLLALSSMIAAGCLPIIIVMFSYLLDFLIIFDPKLKSTLSELYEAGSYLVASCMVAAIVLRVKSILSSIVYNRLAAQSFLSAFEHVQQNSHMYFIDNDPEDISAEISYFSKTIVRTLRTILDNLLPLSIIGLSALGFLLYIDNSLSTLVLFAVIIFLMTSILFAKVAPQNVLKEDKLEEELDYKIYDTLDNHLSVMLNHSFETERKKVEQSLSAVNSSKTWSMIRNDLLLTTAVVIGLVFIDVMFSKILRHWHIDYLSVGEGFAAIILSAVLIYCLYSINASALRLAVNLFDLKESLNFIREPEQIKASKAGKRLRIRKGKIEFKKVSFDYQSNDKMFIDKSLTIEAKQKVCLVGLSGSGKTTFAYLIPRIYAVSSGKIEIDGQDISKVSLKSLRESISFVGEDIALFNGSFRENIKYGSVDTDEEDIIEAASVAGCHDFIANLENGYETQYHEDMDISPTIQLKIQIARAILKDAPIVIVDEKAVSLDSHSEKQIQDALKYLCKNKTSIIIARRAETAKTADRILVFEGGTIVEDGSHKELLKQGEHYADFWELQSNGFLPENIDE